MENVDISGLSDRQRQGFEKLRNATFTPPQALQIVQNEAHLDCFFKYYSVTWVDVYQGRINAEIFKRRFYRLIK